MCKEGCNLLGTVSGWDSTRYFCMPHMARAFFNITQHQNLRSICILIRPRTEYDHALTVFWFAIIVVAVLINNFKYNKIATIIKNNKRNQNIMKCLKLILLLVGCSAVAAQNLSAPGMVSFLCLSMSGAGCNISYYIFIPYPIILNRYCQGVFKIQHATPWKDVLKAMLRVQAGTGSLALVVIIGKTRSTRNVVAMLLIENWIILVTSV